MVGFNYNFMFRNKSALRYIYDPDPSGALAEAAEAAATGAPSGGDRQAAAQLVPGVLREAATATVAAAAVERAAERAASAVAQTKAQAPLVLRSAPSSDSRTLRDASGGKPKPGLPANPLWGDLNAKSKKPAAAATPPKEDARLRHGNPKITNRAQEFKVGRYPGARGKRSEGRGARGERAQSSIRLDKTNYPLASPIPTLASYPYHPTPYRLTTHRPTQTEFQPCCDTRRPMFQPTHEHGRSFAEEQSRSLAEKLAPYAKVSGWGATRIRTATSTPSSVFNLLPT